jgi:hypothetical protein
MASFFGSPSNLTIHMPHFFGIAYAPAQEVMPSLFYAISHAFQHDQVKALQ